MDYMDISGVSGRQRLLPWKSSGLEPRWTDAVGLETPSSERNVAPTLRMSCGSSWEIEFVVNTNQSSRIMLSISKMKFLIPLG